MKKLTFTKQIAEQVSTEQKKQMDYIANYYSRSLLTFPKDKGLQFGLPNPYLVPDCDFFTEFFYWDTYFMLLGLFLFEEGKEIGKGIIQNFAYEVERFGKIPNNNAYYSLSRSQSPYFAPSIYEYLQFYPKEIKSKWIQDVINSAIKEYTLLWTANDNRNAKYLTETGLSRYWDIHSDLDIFAEYESGWDTTSRFQGKCMSVNPIDLNSQLYLYEKIFAWYFGETGDTKKANEWNKKMNARAKKMTELFWNEKDGMFYDYNYVDKKQIKFVSTAAFFPLYAGYATQEQANKMVPKLLKVLEADGGVLITEKVDKKASYINQWDYPNGWAPLQWIASNALQQYGFTTEAQRVKSKWTTTCDYWFKQDNCFYEKYNVVNPKSDVICKTPRRKGFGWTNGVYLRFNLTK